MQGVDGPQNPAEKGPLPDDGKTANSVVEAVSATATVV